MWILVNVFKLGSHTSGISKLQSIFNHTLASGSSDNTITIWNVDSGERIRTLIGHSKTIQTLKMLSNNLMASGSFDNTIQIWNVDCGECVLLCRRFE